MQPETKTTVLAALADGGAVEIKYPGRPDFWIEPSETAAGRPFIQVWADGRMAHRYYEPDRFIADLARYIDAGRAYVGVFDGSSRLVFYQPLNNT